MDAALEAPLSWSPVEGTQTLGPLIHNPQAIQHLTLSGIQVAATPSDITAGRVVIRAHGITLDDLRDLNARKAQGRLRMFNATCPEVGRVQSIIKKYSNLGFFVVIAGSDRHAEVVAHKSYASHGCAVVADAREAEALPEVPAARILLVAQTTFLTREFTRIAKCLRGRGWDLVVRNTICVDTWERQEEARKLMQNVGSVVVVGGRESNNTLHLVAIARSHGKPVQHVETAQELDTMAFETIGTVGILAGASTPNWIVGEVADKLALMDHHPSWTRPLNLCLHLFQVPLALFLAFLTLALHWLMGFPITWASLGFPQLLIFGLCALAPFCDPLGLRAKGSAMETFLGTHRKVLLGFGFFALGASAVYAIRSNHPLFAIASLIAILVFAFPRRLKVGGNAWTLRRIRASKDIGQAIGPAFLLLGAVIPLHVPVALSRLPLAFGTVAALCFAYHGDRHIRDFCKDRVLGPETLPAAVGPHRARSIVRFAFTLGLAGLCTLTGLRVLGSFPVN